MQAATAIVHSVPQSGSGIRQAMSGLLSGLPLRDSEYSVVLRPEISESEVAVLFERLSSAEKSVIVRSHCKLGDTWNQLHTPEFKAVCAAWKSGVAQRIPNALDRERYFRMLSKYGVVATDWPVVVRTDKYGWTYMRTHLPDGTLISSRSKAAPCFTSVTPMITDSDVRFEFRATGDKRIVGRITPDHLEAIRVAMGWVLP